MSISVSIDITSCPFCLYLNNLKIQYGQIGMDYPTYLAKIDQMLHDMVGYNIQADASGAVAYWTAQEASLASLKSAAFTDWVGRYTALYTAPAIPSDHI